MSSFAPYVVPHTAKAILGRRRSCSRGGRSSSERSRNTNDSYTNKVEGAQPSPSFELLRTGTRRIRQLLRRGRNRKRENSVLATAIVTAEARSETSSKLDGPSNRQRRLLCKGSTEILNSLTSHCSAVADTSSARSDDASPLARYESRQNSRGGSSFHSAHSPGDPVADSKAAASSVRMHLGIKADCHSAANRTAAAADEDTRVLHKRPPVPSPKGVMPSRQPLQSSKGILADTATTAATDEIDASVHLQEHPPQRQRLHHLHVCSCASDRDHQKQAAPPPAEAGAVNVAGVVTLAPPTCTSAPVAGKSSRSDMPQLGCEQHSRTPVETISATTSMEQITTQMCHCWQLQNQQQQLQKLQKSNHATEIPEVPRSGLCSSRSGSSIRGSSSTVEPSCPTAALRLKICMRLREQALLLQQLEERRLLTQQLLNARRRAKKLHCLCSCCTKSEAHQSLGTVGRETGSHCEIVCVAAAADAAVYLPTTSRVVGLTKVPGDQAPRQNHKGMLNFQKQDGQPDQGAACCAPRQMRAERQLCVVAAHGAYCTLSHQQSPKPLGDCAILTASRPASQAKSASRVLQEERASFISLPSTGKLEPSSADEEVPSYAAVATASGKQQQSSPKQDPTGAFDDSAATEGGAVLGASATETARVAPNDPAVASASLNATRAHVTAHGSSFAQQKSPGCICRCRCGVLKQRQVFALPGETIQLVRDATAASASAAEAASLGTLSSKDRLRPRRALPQPLHSPKQYHNAGVLWSLLQHELQQELQQHKQLSLTGHTSRQSAASAEAVRQALQLVKSAEQALLCSTKGPTLMRESSQGRNSGSSSNHAPLPAASSTVAPQLEAAPLFVKTELQEEQSHTYTSQKLSAKQKSLKACRSGGAMSIKVPCATSCTAIKRGADSAHVLPPIWSANPQCDPPQISPRILEEPAAPQPLRLRKNRPRLMGYGEEKALCSKPEAPWATQEVPEATVHIGTATETRIVPGGGQLPYQHRQPTLQKPAQTCPLLRLPVMNSFGARSAERLAGSASPDPLSAESLIRTTEPCGATISHTDLSCCTLLPSSSNSSRIGSLVATTVTEAHSPRQPQNHQQQQQVLTNEQQPTSRMRASTTSHGRSPQTQLPQYVKRSQQQQHLKQPSVAAAASLDDSAGASKLPRLPADPVAKTLQCQRKEWEHQDSAGIVKALSSPNAGSMHGKKDKSKFAAAPRRRLECRQQQPQTQQQSSQDELWRCVAGSHDIGEGSQKGGRHQHDPARLGDGDDMADAPVAGTAAGAASVGIQHDLGQQRTAHWGQWRGRLGSRMAMKDSSTRTRRAGCGAVKCTNALQAVCLQAGLELRSAGL
ncbi:uncharacterized protein LOC34620422 [Cyclospora cayetanensis]|uniref:Uncharacterized protein LOC34620422 n=1 Tax=Cyclospora cayetanensis TaxID=88456 RepID=A0A6P6S0K5_9EIME|nr:uncharacterized protein LOC34620422 [Cyclospora cayetanensis]